MLHAGGARSQALSGVSLLLAHIAARPRAPLEAEYMPCLARRRWRYSLRLATSGCTLSAAGACTAVEALVPGYRVAQCSCSCLEAFGPNADWGELLWRTSTMCGWNCWAAAVLPGSAIDLFYQLSPDTRGPMSFVPHWAEDQLENSGGGADSTAMRLAWGVFCFFAVARRPKAAALFDTTPQRAAVIVRV